MNGKPEKCYGTGAVVRRTGLSAPNIRMWEKRYGAVVPERTASNRRLYSAEDVERLTLLHALTEHGHTIGNIANLSLSELQERFAEEIADASPPSAFKAGAEGKRLLAVGAGLVEALSAKGILNVEIEALPGDLRAASVAPDLPQVDLVVIETEALFPEITNPLQDILRRTRASRVILVYRFTTSKVAQALARAIPELLLLAAPLSDDQLRRECLVQLRGPVSPDPAEIPSSGPIPERLYSNEQLSRFARASTPVECECPQHLAELLRSLSAFEKYSRECKDRSPEDALLHDFLHRTTARARRTMEEALQRVVETEGIALG